ncbi:MAG: ornithine cyclodeaminase [Lachnospiraceae bacterium]
MKIIQFDKIKELNISPIMCYQWVCEAIALKKDVLLPAKISLKPGIEGVFYNTMPVIIPYANVGGVKVVTRYPGREPVLDSEILLYDLENGNNIALTDGNWITAMRTGAVAAHSVKMFAVDGFKEIGIIGLGNTARAALKVLLAIYPEKKMKIKLKMYKNQHNLFAEEFSSFNNVTFIYCESFEKVIYGSDVVISAATVFENNICEDRYFKEGVLVIPIHTKGFTNCDLFFDKVFADDTNHVKEFRYFDKYRYFAEVSDVVNGIKTGRENNKERILAYNIGIALHDIYFANKIYKLVEDKCEEISLNSPAKKFWI